MSGEAGVCPIGPAAKPANPAPSDTSPSKFDMGTSLADGFAFMSTNCAKKNSIPSSSALLLIASAAGRAMVVAIPPSLSWVRAGANCSTRGAELLAAQANIHVSAILSATNAARITQFGSETDPERVPGAAA